VILPAQRDAAPVLRVEASGPGAPQWTRWDHPALSAGPDGAQDPEDVVRELFFTWVVRDVARLDALLAPDYRFFSDDPDAGIGADGLSRDDELRIVEHMASGFVNRAGQAIPPVTRADVIVAAIERRPDPAALPRVLDLRTDLEPECALVVARGVRLTIENAGGLLATEAHDHTFLLERGAGAALPGTERAPAASLGWRIVRWWEGRPLDGEAMMASRESRVPDAHLALAARRLTGPRVWPVELELSLPNGEPARVSLYDVSGRVVERQSLSGAAGRQRFTIANGDVKPGVYFLRLEQARQAASLRLVVMR
jgi:hypothetical protein